MRHCLQIDAFAQRRVVLGERENFVRPKTVVLKIGAEFREEMIRLPGAGIHHDPESDRHVSLVEHLDEQGGAVDAFVDPGGLAGLQRVEDDRVQSAVDELVDRMRDGGGDLFLVQFALIERNRRRADRQDLFQRVDIGGIGFQIRFQRLQVGACLVHEAELAVIHFAQRIAEAFRAYPGRHLIAETVQFLAIDAQIVGQPLHVPDIDEGQVEIRILILQHRAPHRVDQTLGRVLGLRRIDDRRIDEDFQMVIVRVAGQGAPGYPAAEDLVVRAFKEQDELLHRLLQRRLAEDFGDQDGGFLVHQDGDRVTGQDVFGFPEPAVVGALDGSDLSADIDQKLDRARMGIVAVVVNLAIFGENLCHNFSTPAFTRFLPCARFSSRPSKGKKHGIG